MRPPRRFHPSAFWSLEDRIVLSHASALAEVARPAARALSVVFHGPYTTTVQFGVDTESAVASLTGTSRIPRIGAVGLHGTLSNTVVFPSHQGTTEGTLTLTGANASAGSLVLQVSGPYANLAPTLPELIHLTFTVKKATGAFSRFAGGHGQASLTLFPSSATSSGGGGIGLTHVSHGNFSLALAGG